MAKHRDSIARQSLIWNPEVKIKNAWRRDTVKVLKAEDARSDLKKTPKTDMTGKLVTLAYSPVDGLRALTRTHFIM